VVVVIVFRSSIRSVLTGPIKRWSVGPSGAVVEYWDRLTEEALERLPAEATEHAADTSGGGLIGELEPVAELSPRAAVMEAFARVEAELRRIVTLPPSLKPDDDELARFGARHLAVIARTHDRISEPSFSAIDGLVVMRNLAAHAGQIDRQQALEFVHLADAVLYALSHDKPSAAAGG
jgi:hypothetical protein